MISLFFQILKIFGILALVIITVLLLALLIPVKVKVKVKYFEKLKLDFKFRLLLGIQYSFNTFETVESSNHSIKFFGLDLLKIKNFFKIKSNKNLKSKKKSFENNINKQNNEDIFQNNKQNYNYKNNQKYLKKSSHKSIEKENLIKNRTNKLKNFFKFIKLVDTIFIKELFLFFYKIFKTAKIKNLNALVEYNLKDPFLTGVVLAIFNIIIPFIPYDIQVLPNFNDERLKLDFSLETTISLFRLILCIISFIRKDSVRKIIFYKGD